MYISANGIYISVFETFSISTYMAVSSHMSHCTYVHFLQATIDISVVNSNVYFHFSPCSHTWISFELAGILHRKSIFDFQQCVHVMNDKWKIIKIKKNRSKFVLFFVVNFVFVLVVCW